MHYIIILKTPFDNSMTTVNVRFKFIAKLLTKYLCKQGYKTLATLKVKP